MAYVPPHKRYYSKDNENSPQLPPPRPAHFSQNPRIRSSASSHSQSSAGFQIVYAKKSVCKWFVVGFPDDDSDDGNQLPLSLQLHPVSLESLCPKFGEKKPFILVDCEAHQHQPQGARGRSGWEVVAARVLQDLLSSFENLRIQMEAQNSEEILVKPVLVARFGKVLFHGGSSLTQEAMGGNSAFGTMLRQLHRTFYTNIPTSYMEKMKTGLPLLELGLELEYAEKDLYHVKLSDTDRPEANISCKCRIVKEQNKLQLYKIQLNQVRQMVVDFSCIQKSLDLRLMLCPKRRLTNLKDDEMQCIQNLIESAVIDPNVKGGLRWPLGKASSGDRFSVVGAWHTLTKAYRNPSLRLKVRDADRFDFHTSTGDHASEVFLILKEVVSELQVQKVDTALISKLLEDTIKLIWDHFLNCDHFLG